MAVAKSSNGPGLICGASVMTAPDLWRSLRARRGEQKADRAAGFQDPPGRGQSAARLIDMERDDRIAGLVRHEQHLARGVERHEARHLAVGRNPAYGGSQANPPDHPREWH